MKIKDRDKLFDFFAWILFIFWIISVFLHFYLGKFEAIFWFCNISVAFLAIAYFQRSILMIYLFLAPAIFFQTPWILDWVIYLIFGFSLFDLVTFYQGLPAYFMVFSFIRHSVSIPLALVMLFFLKPIKIKNNHIVIWLLGILTLILFSLFMPAKYNLNCAHASCSELFNFPFYSLLWIVLVLAISFASLKFIVLPLHNFIYRKIYK